MDRFRDELWTQLEPIYQAILAHPFLAGLVDATLSAEAFGYYVSQDAHYLRDYARALAVTAAKGADEDVIAQFCTDAAEAITVERGLHAGLLRELGRSDGARPAEEVQPTTLAYTSYLLRTVYQGSFTEAVAAVLPCYWIYAEVGRTLLSRTAQQPSANPLYQRWIDTYGGTQFQQTVERVLGIVDGLGAGLSGDQRIRFSEHVLITARYEWLFWDAAWRLETWPAELG